MENYITYKGIIHFDPTNRTKKHLEQSTWKRMAIITIIGEVSEYYAWFLKNKYDLILNKPLRGSHISFINDSLNDMMKGLNCSEKEAEKIWDEVKKKWDGVEIEICLDLDVRGNSKHWWLNIPESKRKEIHNIRKEFGLDRPYWGLHMSLGHANEKHLKHSEYILSGIVNGFDDEKTILLGLEKLGIKK